MSSPGGRAVPASGLLLKALPRGPWVRQCSGLVPTRDLFILCGRRGRKNSLDKGAIVCMPASPVSCPPQEHSFPGGFEEVRLWLPSWNFLQGPLWHSKSLREPKMKLLHAAWLHDPWFPEGKYALPVPQTLCRSWGSPYPSTPLLSFTYCSLDVFLDAAQVGHCWEPKCLGHV